MLECRHVHAGKGFCLPLPLLLLILLQASGSSGECLRGSRGGGSEG